MTINTQLTLVYFPALKASVHTLQVTTNIFHNNIKKNNIYIVLKIWLLNMAQILTTDRLENKKAEKSKYFFPEEPNMAHRKKEYCGTRKIKGKQRILF